jgi:hypothetical protein
MQTVVIEISGGVVQQVYCDHGLQVIQIDWDAGDSPGDACEIGEIPVQSFATFPSDTRKAVQAYLK